MPHGPEIPERIRAKLESGALPSEPAGKMYAGYGHGQACSGCDEPILAAQIEYEIDYGGDRSYRLHLGCAGLWEAECRRRGHRRPGC